MFDIGFWEMLVIGVMALVVLGPERLPGAIRSTISTIRSIKDVANGFKQEVASQLDAHELHANLKKAESLGMENLGKDLQDSVNELKAAAASVQTPYKKNKDGISELESNSMLPSNRKVGVQSESPQANSATEPVAKSEAVLQQDTPTQPSNKTNND